MMSFLKEGRGGWLKKCWSLVLETGTLETCLLVSRWVHTLVGALGISRPLEEILAAVGRNFWRDVT
jgi:hypothetical protein